MPIFSEKIINDLSGRSVATHDGVGLSCKWPTAGLTETQRRKYRYSLTFPKYPDHGDIAWTGRCLLVQADTDIRFDRHFECKSFVFVPAHHVWFCLYAL